jgi:RNA polymerase sigma factor (sigma-70 family)
MNELLPDQELMKLIAARNEEALKKLYAQYEKPIYSFAYRMVRDAMMSEEIVQELFLHIWNTAERFDGAQGKLTSWMFALTRNITIDLLRKKRSRTPQSMAEPDQLHFVADERMNTAMSNQQADKMCELVELYALDALSEEEAALFKEHLKTCEACREQLIELQQIVDLLPKASEPVEVPQGMRERVLGHVLGSTVEQNPNTEVYDKVPDEQALEDNTDIVTVLGPRVTKPEKIDRKARYWQLISLGLSAAVIGLGLYTYTLKGTMNGLQTELAAVKGSMSGLEQELSAVTQQLAIANKPSDAFQVNKIVTLNPAAENFISKGLASIVIDNKGTHLIVQAEDLPQVNQQEAFQVWLIKDNQPVNAGTFSPYNGKGVIYFTFEPKDYDTVAITLEPDANGVKPRGTIVLAGGLKS